MNFQVKIDRQSTAADIARTVANQLGLSIQNPTLVEECPDNVHTMLDPLDYPMDRFLLWPQQAKSGKYTANKYKFREVASSEKRVFKIFFPTRVYKNIF